MEGGLEWKEDENSDTILYVGFSFRTGEGYHQQTANNGMSPLPGIFFSNCTTR